MWTCPSCDAQTEDGFDVCWTCRTPNGQRSIDANNRQDFIVSTTETIETHEIVEYFGPVSPYGLRRSANKVSAMFLRYNFIYYIA